MAGFDEDKIDEHRHTAVLDDANSPVQGSCRFCYP